MTERGGAFLLFVNGTLMRGLDLHGNLAGAEFVEEVATAPIYRLYSIGDAHPGMFEVADGGVAVAGELYRVWPDVWRRVAAGEPAGLYKAPVRLTDGRTVEGILFPRELAEGKHRDISDFADWRAYLKGCRLLGSLPLLGEPPDGGGRPRRGPWEQGKLTQ